jgi:hypothetical protein
MRSKSCSLMSAVSALILAVAIVPGAIAQCGVSSKLIKPSSFHQQLGSAHLLRTALAAMNDGDGDADDFPIVGMWHVIFTAHTVNGNPIPSNAYPVIDNAMVVWHSDKTEIMESARPPQDGNFCLGVWEKTGRSTYYVNHLPWLGNDLANAPSGIGNPAGGAQITERVTLSSDGNHYSGTFTLTAFDPTGRSR